MKKIILLILTIAIIGSVASLIIKKLRMPPPNKNATILQATTPPITVSMPPETKLWSTYRSSDPPFSIRYPSDWNYFTPALSIIEFIPLQIADYEIEKEPKIILQIMPVSQLQSSYDSLDDWFEQTIRNDPDRFDAKKEIWNNAAIYYFSEGVGEYPHEQYVVTNNKTAIWFSIEASDVAMHQNLSLMAHTVQF